MIPAKCLATRIGAAAWFAVVVLLGGCATRPDRVGATRLDRVMRKDPSVPSGYVIVDAGEASRFVTVFRGGRPLGARPPFTLEQGDEVETGADGAAVIQFPDGGIAVIDVRTRVRVGSLEVLFGRVFASVRGLFSIESENVVAGVEGTDFMFEVRADRGVRVVVLDGVVVGRSKTKSWDPIRLRPGVAFSSRYPNREPPRVGPASQRELDDIRAWVRSVIDAPRSGYCCDGRKVFASASTECRGFFSATESEARRSCTIGWCCAGNQVTQTIRARCGGAFYTDRQSAERACAPKPEVGWCCEAGRVTSGTRDQCRGKFYTDRQSAERACAPAPTGWCCLPNYRLEQMTNTSCIASKGKFYTDPNAARAACTIQ
jgi:hypothetical protein